MSEPLAASTNLTVNLTETIASLRDEGVSVFAYPLNVQLVQPRALAGAFQFGITGPPGIYPILGSTNLTDWSQVAVATNTLGALRFTDTTAHLFAIKFYRAGPSFNQ